MSMHNIEFKAELRDPVDREPVTWSLRHKHPRSVLRKVGRRGGPGGTGFSSGLL